MMAKPMKYIFGTLLSICLSTSLFAQINVQWETRYNGLGGNTPEYVVDMVVDGSGNVYVTGSAYTAASGYDIVTRKYDNAGTVLWTQVFNGSGNGLDEASAMTLDASGNVYVCGTAFRGGSNYDYTTIKYNNSGVQQWQIYYDAGASLYDDASDIAVDASGNVFVTGSGQVAANNTNFRTVKYNSAGAQQWVANFSSTGNNIDQGRVILVDGAGDVYVAGNAFNTGENLNYRVIKYNTAGAQVWTMQHNQSAVNSYDYPTAMVLAPSGTIYVTGYTYNGAGSDDDILTISVSSGGVLQNNVVFNGTASNTDIANAIKLDASGNVYVVGRVKNTGTAEDFFAIKYNASLSQQWNVSLNGSGANYDEATDLAFDNFGNLYVTGYSYLTSSNNDFFTAKFNPTSGAVVWTTRFNGTANNSDQGRKIDVDATGNVYISGDSRGSGTASDYSTIKYCQHITDAGPDQQICVGETAQLSATGGSAWLWNNGSSLSSTTIPNPIASPGSTTTYIVSSTDANNCTDLDTVVVVVNPLPGPVIIPNGPTSFCIGDSVQLTASGFSSYTWSTGSTSPSIMVNSSGTFTVTVTDVMNCQNSTNMSVTVFSLPNVDAGSNVTYCVGDSAQLNASGAQNYVWSTSPTLSSATISNPYSIASTNTWYYVTGTDVNGCVNSDSVMATVNTIPATPSNIFVTSNYTLVTNCSGNIQWYWDGTAVSGSAGTQQIYTLTGNGTYWNTCTDANGCTSLNSDTVVVNSWTIEESDLVFTYSLIPNPATSIVDILFDFSPQHSIEITITDLSGRIIYSEILPEGYSLSRKSISLSDFSSGIYLVQLQIANQTHTQKLVIQH